MAYLNLLMYMILFGAFARVLTPENHKDITIKESKDYKKYIDQKKYLEIVKIEKQKEKDAKENNSTKDKLLIVFVIFIFIIAFIYTGYKLIFLSGDPVAGSAFYFGILYTFGIIMLKLRSTHNNFYAYKNTAVKNMINDKYPNAEFDPNKDVPESEYYFKKYRPGYNMYVSSYFFKMKLDNRNEIMITDLFTINVNSKNSKFFSGLYGYYEISETLNIKDELFIGRYLSNNEARTIKVDNEEFNNNFAVLGVDEITAYKIFTPNNIERLLGLLKKIEDFQFLIKDNRLYFSLNSYGQVNDDGDETVKAKNLYYFHKSIEQLIFILKEMEKEIIDKLS